MIYINGDYDELIEYKSADDQKTKDVFEIIRVIVRIKGTLSIKKECFLINSEQKLEIKVSKNNKNKIQCQICDCQKDLTTFGHFMKLLTKLEKLLNTSEKNMFNVIEQEITNKDNFMFDRVCDFLFSLEKIIIRSK